MATLAEEYRLVDDPVTGERWVQYPTGDWACVNMSLLNEWATDGTMEELDPATRLLISFLTG